MTRIALLPSEPLRAQMAGIGVRYLELARRLPRPGIEVVLVTAGEVAEVPEVPCEVRAFRRGELARVLEGCDAAVAQGQLANDLLLELPELPSAIDLYDPWMVENFAYLESLGLEPYRNDHATWVLQLGRGDLFLCSSEEQRLFYLGFLTALGRVHPENAAADPDLRRLIVPLPFGLELDPPPHRPLLEPLPGTARILFGGLYDWYDPLTLLDGLEGVGRPWRLTLVRNPNPDSTPQRLLQAVERRCRDRGWWQGRVELVDWVPAERRFDLLRDVDVLAAPHRPTIETRLSLRTRFLEALALGVPVLSSDGGALSRRIAEKGAGWVAPPGDPAAVCKALEQILAGGEEVERRREAGRELAAEHQWERVLGPLVEFCRAPWRDESKRRYVVDRPTAAVEEPWAKRIGRRLRRRLERSG